MSNEVGGQEDVAWLVGGLEERLARFKAPRSEAEIAESRLTDRDKRVAECWTMSNIPLRFASPDLLSVYTAHSGWSEALSACVKLCTTPPSGKVIVISGLPGSGKTCLVAETVRACCQNFLECRYTTADGFLQVQKPGGSGEIWDFIDPFLLAVDNIIPECSTDWDKRRLFTLIDRRFNLMRSTLLVVACPADTVSEILYPGITDRCNEGGALIDLHWGSFRGTRNVKPVIA